MTSHRQVFQSSAILGGASVIQMAIGIAKVKFLAVMLGPAGIGLMGLYQNIMFMASILAGCGMGSSGVRQLAAATDDAETLIVIRRTLWIAGLVLGLAGMAILWLVSEPIAYWVFGDNAHAREVGWLGLGLLFTVVAASQTAILQGLRQVGELAKVSILSAVVGAFVGVLAVYILGAEGLLWFVLTAPAATFLVATVYVTRLPKPQQPYDLAAIRQQWLLIMKLGIPLMSAGLLTLLTQLAVRSVVLRELGLDASGYFQAAWAISFTYVGFVLNAMALDYFPRLTTAINDHERAAKLVNEQAEMALLMVGPILMVMITLAPAVIHLLYAENFGPAVEILRWQVLGDILKVASVPIVFIFLAKGHGGVAIAIQIIWSLAYLGPVILGIEKYGLVMAGVGFGFAYLIYYGVVGIIAFKVIEFLPSRRNWIFTLLLLLVAGSILALSGAAPAAAVAFGAVATVLITLYCFRRLDHLIGLTALLRKKFL